MHHWISSFMGFQSTRMKPDSFSPKYIVTLTQFYEPCLSRTQCKPGGKRRLVISHTYYCEFRHTYLTLHKIAVVNDIYAGISAYFVNYINIRTVNTMLNWTNLTFFVSACSEAMSEIQYGCGHVVLTTSNRDSRSDASFLTRLFCLSSLSSHRQFLSNLDKFIQVYSCVLGLGTWRTQARGGGGRETKMLKCQDLQGSRPTCHPDPHTTN